MVKHFGTGKFTYTAKRRGLKGWKHFATIHANSIDGARRIVNREYVLDKFTIKRV